MNRRSFLLSIPFVAIASKTIAKEIPVNPLDKYPDKGWISSRNGILTTSDPKIIYWLDNHPHNLTKKFGTIEWENKKFGRVIFKRTQ